MSGAALTEAASASAGRLAIPAQQQQFLALILAANARAWPAATACWGCSQPQSPPSAEGLRPAAAVQKRLPTATRRWSLACPTTPMGPRHENTARALKFGRQLRGRFGLPVYEVDERYTTTEALALGAKRCRRGGRLHHLGTNF